MFVLKGLEADVASSKMGYKSFPGVKWPGLCADHPLIKKKQEPRMITMSSYRYDLSNERDINAQLQT